MAEAKKIVTAVNGAQTCLFVGLASAKFMFASLMRHEAKPLIDDVPHEARTPGAVAIWEQIRSAVVGCIDYICEHGNPWIVDAVLQAYADYGTDAERRNALLLLFDQQIVPSHPYQSVEQRRLRLLLKDTPVLKYIYEHPSK